MINRFEGDYAFLSNFHPWGFTYKGTWYPTAEHAFQAAKAYQEYDMAWVRESSTPGVAKRRGRKVELRKDWEYVKIDTMLRVVQAKFDIPQRKQFLAATGEQHLVEGNYWHDNFWGSCLCRDCGDAGKNYLGKILMLVRKDI